MAAIAGGLFLVQKTTFFKPKANLSGTRVEIFGPTVKQGKTTSRQVKLRIIYELPQAKNSSSIEPFTMQGDFTKTDIPEGQYTIFFQNPSTDSSGIVPESIDIEITKRNTTVVQISSDGQSIECDNGLKIDAIHCLKNDSDLLSSSPHLKIETIPTKGFLITVIPKGLSDAELTREPIYPTHFKVVNVKPELIADYEFVEAKKAFSRYGREFQFSQNNQEIDWDIAEGQEGNGLKKVYVQFDDRSDLTSVVWDQIILEP